jgi:deoxyribonuclease-4
VIWLGPAGNAIDSEEKGTEGSLKYIKKIGLNAQEIEFVRNVYLNQQRAEQIGELAKDLGISLTVHAPYYINLNSEKSQIVEKSKAFILDSLDRAERMNAKFVVVHAAYYGNSTQEQTFEKVRNCLIEILERAKDLEIQKAKLAIETMAKKAQFGGLDEVIKLCKSLKLKVVPCIDFAHIYCRANGKINYAEIFEKLKVLRLKHLISHFSNVKYNPNTKKFADVHIPINSHPPFKELAKEILRRRIDITLISESPILERDALKMKKIFENLR